MGIILKFILRSISEKKLRTFLIVLAIVLSSGVFFASMSISGSITEMILSTIKGSFGDADLIISPGPKSPSQAFYTAGAEKYSDNLEYVIGQVGGEGTYVHKIHEEITVSLRGIDFDDIQRMTPFTIEKEYNLYPFEGRKIILSRGVAEKYGFSLGDVIDVKMSASVQKFVISGIASPGGPFVEDGQSISAVVPRDMLSSLYNIRGRVSLIYVKLKNPVEKQNMIKTLSEEYKNYRVAEPIPIDQLKRETSGITAVFMMLSCIVFFMSIFIIYSSFKVITAERLPVIGTFRSMGATRRMTNYILFAESAAYGVIGGILGCVTGIGILYVLSSFIGNMANAGPGMQLKTVLQFSPINFVISFLMAVILCFVSSIIPILKVSRIPIKDIVLNFMQKPQQKRKNLRLILGVIFMATAFLLSLPDNDDLRPILGVGGMFLSLTSLVMLVPYLTAAFVKLFEQAYIFIFGNIGILAAKNLRENKSIINNIAMLAIGISSLLLFNTASYDSTISITDMYKDTHYDIMMYTGRSDRNMVRQIMNVEGVKDIYGDYQQYNLDVVGHSERLRQLRGVDFTKFLDFWTLNIKEDPYLLLKALDEDRNILLTNVLKERYGVNVGDTIRFKMKAGEKSYRVIGFFENLQNNSDCALISERFFKSDMQAKAYSGLYIKTYGSSEEVAQNLRNEFKRFRPYIETKEQREKSQLDNNKQMMLLMSGFSVLAMIIGIFGIINNLLISFIERKHSLAVFRSMGMSKHQIISMVFIESLTGGLIGGILGVVGGLLMVTILAGVNTAATIHYPVASFFTYTAAGAFIMLVASISPALKSSKMNIVSAIKFE